MNTKNNQRFQETETAIIDAFIALLQEKEPEKISIRELCQCCGINRSSFYLHFTDIYDLMLRIDDRMAGHYTKLFTETGERWNIGERFVRMFAFIREHRDFYRVYLERNRSLKVLEAALPERAREGQAALEKKMGWTGNETLYHQAFFNAGLAALLREWVRRDCPESPEELGDILVREYNADRALFRE